MYLLKEMKVEHRFLSFAVNNDAPSASIRLTAGGVVLGELEVQLAAGEISFWTFVDISEYQGELLKIECKENIHIAGAILQSEQIAGKEELYFEKHRPHIHFTPQRGRLGAPLDLQYIEGEWKLFYEHNPIGNKELNKYTGCAVSKDLIHWREAKEVYELKNFQDITSKSKKKSPYFLELPVDDKLNEKKWVCITDKGNYTIGHFTGGRFIAESPEDTLWVGSYSSLISSAEDSASLCIQVGLEQGTNNPEMPFNQQLMIPKELMLKTTPDGIKLFASPVRELQNLRIWKRSWSDFELKNGLIFSSKLDFKIAPGDYWPDIRILPAEGTLNDITSDMLEAIIALETAEVDLLEIRLFGVSIFLNISEKTLGCMDITAPLPCDKSNVKLQLLLDRSSLEIMACDGRVVLAAAVSPDYNKRDIELFCHKGTVVITSAEVFGLRRIWNTEEENKLIEEGAKENAVVYQSESYTIYNKRIEDAVYGEPAAFVPDRNTIVSPVRLAEEFEWRKSKAGDMNRVIDRGNVWHPNYMISKFPDIFTGYNTFDAAYRLALDIFYRCASDEFARPGEKGLWSAGQFQGPGEGFGVWVRDTTHVAIRIGNLLDPAGARRSLLYTTMAGFDNGVDGIGLPIVGIWDYFLATGDLTLVKETWLNLKGRIARLEERFDSRRGLIAAEQSTSNDAFPEPECGGYSLATEIYFMEAFRAMAKMGKYMEEDQSRINQWEEMGDLLLNNIRKQYWKESAGFFTSGPVGSESFSNDFWESSGQEMAVWPRYGIANKEQRAKILDKLPEVAMNEFGVNVFPYREEVNHFCNAAWVVWTAGMAAAAGRERNLDLLMRLIAQQVRNCVMNKTFYEVIDYKTGRAWRWPGQLWQAAGFISYFYFGVLGLEYGECGLTLTPAVPKLFSNLRIESFRYRKATLDFIVHGWGTQGTVKLDGTAIDCIPADIEGKHTVEVLMR